MVSITYSGPAALTESQDTTNIGPAVADKQERLASFGAHVIENIAEAHGLTDDR